MQGAGAEGSGMLRIESSAPCRPPYDSVGGACRGPRQGGADAGPLLYWGLAPMAIIHNLCNHSRLPCHCACRVFMKVCLRIRGGPCLIVGDYIRNMGENYSANSRGPTLRIVGARNNYSSSSPPTPTRRVERIRRCIGIESEGWVEGE
jgi:hypothetical protein